ncbi:MAG TPA: aldehyde dehydrogenase family protein [Solirubrobacterales bacterium]|jgi:acyl-CoA reductase-like NAD-dependent aldehyde dehydrogenase
MSAQGVEVERYDEIYVGGEWVASSATESLAVVNPTTEEPIARVAAGTAEDVDRAVAAAVAAQPGWAEVLPEERVALVAAIGAGLAERGEVLAEQLTTEVGAPIEFSRAVQIGVPTFTFSTMPEVAAQLDWSVEIGNSIVWREPVGVVGAITPWNYPLHLAAAKVAPALAAGCTVVLKPSEIKPLTAFALAEICAEAGLPAGVLNLVSGLGPVAGEAMAAHPDLDMISFTGSTAAGRRVAELAAADVKRVALELGGKSANVLLDDADFEAAVGDGIEKCFANAGQSCNALTRMLVPRAKLAQVEEIAAGACEAYVAGDPHDEATRLGPLVSARQQERVRGFIRAGIEDGARLLAGGPEAPAGLERGYFVRPTVFSEVANDSRIGREEVFGPVLSIIAYEGEEDAVRIANESGYGLAGGVWSGDEKRAIAVARRLRTGQVEINGGAFNPLAPFGGFRESGNGRELGRFGLEEYTELKAIQL